MSASRRLRSERVANQTVAPKRRDPWPRVRVSHPRQKEDGMKAFGLADEGSSAGVIDVPTPEPGPGEVRVRVHASSVNGFDVFVASGFARTMMEHRYPVVGGKDFAGVIDAVGEGVTRFAVGDMVAGITPAEPFLSSRGAYAEQVVVPAEGFLEP